MGYKSSGSFSFDQVIPVAEPPFDPLAGPVPPAFKFSVRSAKIHKHGLTGTVGMIILRRSLRSYSLSI